MMFMRGDTSAMSQFNLRETILNEMNRSRAPRLSRGQSFYPSECSVVVDDQVIGACERAVWYRLHNTPKTDNPPERMSYIWAMGNAIEAQFIDNLKKSGLYENSSIRFRDTEFNISGELDGMFRLMIDGHIKLCILELKTVANYYAEQMQITGSYRTKQIPTPKATNLMQTMTYLHECRNEPDIVAAKLYYISRSDPGNQREYTIHLQSGAELKKHYPEEAIDCEDHLHYALVESPSVRFGKTVMPICYVEMRFTMEDLLAQFKRLQAMLDNKQIPDRSESLYYTEEQIESKFEKGQLGKTKYNNWVSAGRPSADPKKTPGCALCKDYCDWRTLCFNQDGTPNPQADLIGIDEPRSK